jgi:hypothetical protein
VASPPCAADRTGPDRTGQRWLMGLVHRSQGDETV